MYLPNLNEALKMGNYAANQREDITGLFSVLLGSFSACVSVKYIHDIPQVHHRLYIKEMTEYVTRNIEKIYNCFPSIFFDDRQRLTEALTKDIAVIARDAVGDPKTFSHH